MTSYSSQWKTLASLLDLRVEKLAVKPFFNYVLKEYYNGVDEYGNQIDESSREESFESRWNKARAILLKSK